MHTPRVSIVDGGGANIASLTFALQQRLGVTAELTRDGDRIRTSSHVILPGVGAAASAMKRLRGYGLDEVLRELQQPVLGICLGLQLLAEGSAENQTQCLGIIPGVAKGLEPGKSLPVPNMGWCPIAAHDRHPLLDGVDDGSYFYFVHSFALPVSEYTLAEANHHIPFTAVLARDNFMATQFHPERSAAAGAKILANFLKLDG